KLKWQRIPCECPNPDCSLESWIAALGACSCDSYLGPTKGHVDGWTAEYSPHLREVKMYDPYVGEFIEDPLPIDAAGDVAEQLAECERVLTDHVQHLFGAFVPVLVS